MSLWLTTLALLTMTTFRCMLWGIAIKAHMCRKEYKMPVSGNTMAGAPNYHMVTFRAIDHRGDKTAISIKTIDEPLVAEVSALRTALGAASNANFYEVQITAVYGGVPSASFATDAVFTNTDAVVNILMKDQIDLESFPFEIPAPLGAMVLDGESVDNTNTQLLAVVTGIQGVLGSLTVVPVSYRFTERRNINKATPA